VVALPFFILLVRYGKPVHFSFLVSAAAAAGCWEFLRLLGFGTGKPAFWAGCLGGALLAFGAGLSPPPILILALWAVLLIFFSAAVWLPPGVWPAPRGFAGGFVGVLFVGTTFGSLILLRDLPDGWRWVFLLALVVWGGDTGAYYGGRAWGKRPLIPRLSPKKTVEGACAGVGASLVGGLIAWVWFLSGVSSLNLIEVAALALLLGAIGQIGDLAESAVKRSAGAKDAGGLIPGHGGILDRMDGVTFAGPVLYAILLWRLP
jgi:phosphatidate cytidylyltransferase